MEDLKRFCPARGWTGVAGQIRDALLEDNEPKGQLPVKAHDSGEPDFVVKVRPTQSYDFVKSSCFLLFGCYDQYMFNNIVL